LTLPDLGPEHVEALLALLAAFGEVEIPDIAPNEPTRSHVAPCSSAQLARREDHDRECA
jgi:hypothetical protein